MSLYTTHTGIDETAHTGIDETDVPQSSKNISSTLEEFCLMLPGRKVILSYLLLGKKFRYKRGKAGALKAFKNLESDKLGTLELVPGSRVGSIKLN